MRQLVRVLGVQELGPGESRRFSYRRRGEREEGFVMRWGERLIAFRNYCPHWGVDLDFGEGRFYAAKVDRIVCRNHGALFRPDDGFCDAGPCAGDRLERFEVREDGDDLLVEVPEVPMHLFD